jgi:hypothetical protein
MIGALLSLPVYRSIENVKEPILNPEFSGVGVEPTSIGASDS